VEAIDEVSHEQNLELKIRAIEDFDSRAVGPVLSAVGPSVSVAVPRRKKVGDQWDEVTTWHDVTCFGDLAEHVAESVVPVIKSRPGLR
jgi:single-stranded DNA-binding protein